MRWPDEQNAIKLDYEKNGYVVLRSLFDDVEVAELQANLASYIDDVVPGLPSMDVFYQDKRDATTIKMLPRMNQHDEFFQNLLVGGRLQQVAKFLWSCPASPHDAAFFDKPAKIGEPTPPHQDGYYFHLNPCEALTMWLALDHVDEENGCVRYVSGSHRGPMRPHGRTDVLGFSQGITDFGTEADQQVEVAVCVEPGDVIVHDALTIHRADANRSSDRSRRALGFVYFSSRANVDEAARDRYQDQLAKEWEQAGKI